MKTIHRPLLVFGNLNVAAFDANGEQIPELQKSLAALLAEHIERSGYNPEGVLIETAWGGSWRLFKTTDGGWNRDQIRL